MVKFCMPEFIEQNYLGDAILEEIEARGWTLRQLAERMAGRAATTKEINIRHCELDLMIGVACQGMFLGEKTAQELGRVFGVSPELFLNLDRSTRHLSN